LKNKKYQTVRTVLKSDHFLFFNQFLELFWQLGISCFSIRFWNCSDSLVFLVFRSDFRTVLTVWYFLFFDQILELFWQFGISCFSIRFWNCSNSLVFLVFRSDFRTVLTVWYFFLTVLKSDRKTRNTKLSEQF
jgi:uncharacterized membrane protein